MTAFSNLGLRNVTIYLRNLPHKSDPNIGPNSVNFTVLLTYKTPYSKQPIKLESIVHSPFQVSLSANNSKLNYTKF